MEKEFLTFEQANYMCNLGYSCNEPFKVYEIKYKSLLDEKFCIYANFDYIPAPLKQQAFEFFRHKYNLLSFIDFYENGKYDYVIRNHRIDKEEDFNDGPFITYRSSEKALINRLIKLAQEIEIGK